MKDSLMIKPKKLLIRLLLITALILIATQLAEATTTNFTVQGGGEQTRPISLAVEDHVLIKFSVVGSSDSTLHFSMTYPNGTSKDFDTVGGYFYYSFVCDAEGQYVLHFSNAGSNVDKLVTLDYEVEHYIFGIPQMLFLAMIIAVVCVAAVAAFILMGKSH
jgi:hypothetical protein